MMERPMKPPDYPFRQRKFGRFRLPSWPPSRSRAHSAPATNWRCAGRVPVPPPAASLWWLATRLSSETRFLRHPVSCLEVSCRRVWDEGIVIRAIASIKSLRISHTESASQLCSPRAAATARIMLTSYCGSSPSSHRKANQALQDWNACSPEREGMLLLRSCGSIEGEREPGLFAVGRAALDDTLLHGLV